MQLEDLGYNNKLEKFRKANSLDTFEIGRVIAEHKERYIIRTIEGESEAEITGHLRFTAQDREDFPAVGDWVALTSYDSDFAVIHKILPRYSIIKRKAVGRSGEVQVIAANIDYAFIVQAVDRDFNINRLERYLTICYSSNINPIIILSKTDLITVDKVTEITENIKLRIEGIPIIPISNETWIGYDELKSIIEKGKTYCLLGSSGVGKSTLLNNLSGKTIMRTDAISRSTNKGRHVTSHRELIMLDSGGILIDNPGMREVGIADSADGIETTFNEIINLAHNCKFRDCTHTGETGCAVIEAVEKGELDKTSYKNYLKIEREKAYFESTIAERRRREKIFGRIIKDYHKKDVKQRKH
jgi:ribosome biogenesis GTPase / thiamine phosphate phosphatase